MVKKKISDTGKQKNLLFNGKTQIQLVQICFELDLFLESMKAIENNQKNESKKTVGDEEGFMNSRRFKKLSVAHFEGLPKHWRDYDFIERTKELFCSESQL